MRLRTACQNGYTKIELECTQRLRNWICGNQGANARVIRKSAWVISRGFNRGRKELGAGHGHHLDHTQEKLNEWKIVRQTNGRDDGVDTCIRVRLGTTIFIVCYSKLKTSTKASSGLELPVRVFMAIPDPFITTAAIA